MSARSGRAGSDGRWHDPADGFDRTTPVPHPAPRPLVSICLTVIRSYQLARSGRLSLCRFTPSCSEYAAQAIERHGARRGLYLTARRLSRCRPGGPFGLDPVPE